MPNVKQITELMLQMEEDLKLLENESYGHNAKLVWEFSRFFITEQIKRNQGIQSVSHSEEKKLTQMIFRDKCIFVLSFIKSLLYFNPFISNRKKVLVLANPRRKLDNHGFYEDIYTDEIIRFLGSQKCLIVEHPYLGEHFMPTRYRVRHMEMLKLLIYLHKKMISPAIDIQIKTMAHAVEVYISNAINAQVNITKTIYELAKRFKREYFAYYLWLKILHPKVIFFVCGYGKEPLIYAAKKLKTTTIELQHGVITDYHLGYVVNRNAFKETFADSLFVFGDYWKDISYYPINRQKIFSIGYPYFSKEKLLYKDVAKKNQLLILSQGTIGKKLSEYVVSLLEKNIPNNVQLIYKLHPGEFERWESDYSELFLAQKSGLINVITDEVPLYNLLAESRWQMGVNSTSLFEGIGFNCITYILKLPGYEYMDRLNNAGLVTYIDTEQSLSLEINSAVPDAGNQLFNENWQGNFKQAMRTILREE